MKLYYNPQSRAAVAKWMLDECGAPHETVLVDLQKNEHKSPEFLKINPSGKIPALVDGEARLYENAAICLYLAEKFPEANLAPKVGDPRRARYLTLMVYATSQLEPAMGDELLNLETPPSRGWTSFEKVKDVIEGELGDGKYLFGDWFTAADVMIGSMFIWKRIWGRPRDRDRIEAYVDRLLERPASPKLGAG
jgi:glutathione S-transferase